MSKPLFWLFCLLLFVCFCVRVRFFYFGKKYMDPYRERLLKADASTPLYLTLLKVTKKGQGYICV